MEMETIRGYMRAAMVARHRESIEALKANGAPDFMAQSFIEAEAVWKDGRMKITGDTWLADRRFSYIRVKIRDKVRYYYFDGEVEAVADTMVSMVLTYIK